jgi:hypothetical protein
MAGGRLMTVGDADVDAPTLDGFGRARGPRRNRNLTGALLGALLVVFCATAVGIYTANVGHRHPVLVVVRAVNAGTVIGNADLGEARISADPSVHAVPVSQRDRIVGRVAGVNLVPGTLVTTGQLARGPRLDAGQAVVGLALKAGQLPSGLRPLDPVMLVQTVGAGGTGVSGTGVSGTGVSGSGAGSSGTVLVPQATVDSIEPSADGQTTVVSVMVANWAAAAVAGAGARGEVSVVLLGRGGSAGS